MGTKQLSIGRVWITAAALVSIALAGCGNAKRTPFDGDPAIPKFQMNPLDYCKPDGVGGATGPLGVDRGDAGDHAWGQGGGCVPHSVLQTWGVTFNLDAMKWGGVSEFSFKFGAPPPHVSAFYEVYYVVHDTITVRWAMQWYHTVGIGDRNDPKLVWINYKRVSGTTYIPYWEGTIYLQEAAPGITAFAMRNQISAANTGPAEAGGSIEDVYHALVDAPSAPIP